MKGQLTDDCGREAREPIPKNKKSGPGFPAAAAAPVYPSFRVLNKRRNGFYSPEISFDFFRDAPAGPAASGQTD
jgi:hypothetical protein